MKTKKQSVDHPIAGLSGLALGDFWSWAYSDVLNNVIRSALAEFLIASAPDLLGTPRIEWDAVDLRYRGKGIEVKSAAYLQSWQQDKLSIIRFDIAKKLAWDARTNTNATEPVRSADCYVFCLYPETDPAKVDVLDANAWQFYVLSTEQIEREIGEQKTVGIKLEWRLGRHVQEKKVPRWILASRQHSRAATRARGTAETNL